MKSLFTATTVGIILLCFISSCAEENKDNSKALLGMGFGISNATILVEDLDSARNYYTEILGFDMPVPERFQKGIYPGTHSASVGFADMASFELLALSDSATDSPSVFITSFLEKQEGARTYSLSTSSADETRHWLQSEGYQVDSLQSGRTTADLPKGWDWDSGGPQWRSADFDSKNPSSYLPNFVEYVGFPYFEFEDQWESVHSSWRQYYKHPNGVVGMVAVRIFVSDLKASRKEFKKLGLLELEVDEAETFARFKVAHHQELHLITSTGTEDELDDFLKTRGQGVFALRFEVKSLKETEEFLRKNLPSEALKLETAPERLVVPKEYARGVQLEFVEESREQAALAQIYTFEKGKKLDSVSIQFASEMYVKYCSLCHGNDREGYAADFAPSLRSHSLMATTNSTNYLKHAVSYGRQGTAMAAYAKSQGGPLGDVDIDLLLQYLYELSEVEKPIDISTESILGDAELGKELYGQNCATCHGANGEGVSAPALGNPMLLATASDGFLRYAISEGRDGTPMRAFKDSLNTTELDALTAYLRSRASGWNAPEAIMVTEPLPEDYVLNPQNNSPKFTLREELYVSSEQLLKALQDSSRFLMLDARSKAAWHQAHIPGAISVPYYEDPDTFIKNLPNDSTMIVVYCACPHAASQRVVNTLKRFGYKHTAILDEGVLVWTQRGYPIQIGKVAEAKK